MLNEYHIKNSGWGISYDTKKGRKYRKFAKYQDCKNADSFNEAIVNFGARHAGMTTTFEQRLSAEVCELCGKTEVPLEIHHVNKVKNLKGKQPWEIVMIAKKRKTLAVCKSCHHKIHHP